MNFFQHIEESKSIAAQQRHHWRPCRPGLFTYKNVIQYKRDLAWPTSPNVLWREKWGTCWRYVIGWHIYYSFFKAPNKIEHIFIISHTIPCWATITYVDASTFMLCYWKSECNLPRSKMFLNPEAILQAFCSNIKCTYPSAMATRWKLRVSTQQVMINWTKLPLNKIDINSEKMDSFTQQFFQNFSSPRQVAVLAFVINAFLMMNTVKIVCNCQANKIIIVIMIYLKYCYACKNVKYDLVQDEIRAILRVEKYLFVILANSQSAFAHNNL